MNFQFYVEKLKNSDNYKQFIKKNSDSFVCSGFFVFDKQGSDDKQHFDYYIPLDKKIISFQLENNCNIIPSEIVEKKEPEKISLDCEFDFNDIERLIQDEMNKQGIKNKIQKLLFSFQAKNKKNYLIGTVFISGLGLIKVTIDLSEMKILNFEKKSFFDMIKIKRNKKEENK